MLQKLSPDDWIKAGLKALTRDGFTALKADVIARRLAVSRGSFYWHFADVAAFEQAVMRRWRDIMAEAIIRGLDRVAPRQRLRSLLRVALSGDPALEIAMRAWATSDARAQALIRAVDRRRMSYIEYMLREAGVARMDVRPRAQILYWTYLGLVLSRTPVAGKARERLIDELSALGSRGGFRRRSIRARIEVMDDFPLAPPLIIKDTPKPRRLTTLKEARAYVDEAMRLGHPEPWREVWHRLKAIGNAEDAIEAIGDLRELLIEEDLLLPTDKA